jgi:hypothetical protein
MNGEAPDLRILARKIEQVTDEFGAGEVARQHVKMCCDYLCLLALVIELQAKLGEKEEA